MNDINNTIVSNRRKFIGGSDIPNLLNIGFKSFDEVVDMYINNTFDFIGNEYTQYGNLMESHIRDYVNAVLGINAKPKCKIFNDKRIRCNTDGFDENNNLIIEIKTNNGKHSNKIDYEVQMQLYMWAFDVNYSYLVEYTRPVDFYSGVIYEVHNTIDYFNLEFKSENIKITKITRNDRMINLILKTVNQFWETVDLRKEKLKNE